MANIKLGESVRNLEVNIWRYISIDKLIDLLATESLFFTPLNAYEASDPFEGYPPKASLDAMFKMLGNSIGEMESTIKRGLLKNGIPQNFLNFEISSHPILTNALATYKKLAKRAVVNCWHANEHESEAMWKIYTDNGKGIAIKSTINALKLALEDCPEDISEVNIGMVKYLDYFDPSLQPKDCVVDNRATSPLIKRKSYEHEHELRLYITSVHTEETKPQRVKINPCKLIDKIIISPLTSEPFISSVKQVCANYGFQDKVETSTLLDINKLFDSLIKQI